MQPDVGWQPALAGQADHRLGYVHAVDLREVLRQMSGIAPDAAADLQRASTPGQVSCELERALHDRASALDELVRGGTRPQPRVDVALRVLLCEALPARRHAAMLGTSRTRRGGSLRGGGRQCLADVRV